MACSEGAAGVSPDGNYGLGLLVRLGLAPGLEEPLEQGRAFIGQDPALNLWAPMAGGPFEKAGTMDHRAALGVPGTKDQASDAGMADGTRTHGAGFKRYNQRQAGQPIVSDLLGRCP